MGLDCVQMSSGRHPIRAWLFEARTCPHFRQILTTSAFWCQNTQFAVKMLSVVTMLDIGLPHHFRGRERSTDFLGLDDLL